MASWAASPAHSRALLQGTAPEAVLPDLFNLPACSVYGSHNTTWMRGAPHVRLGLPAFGPDDLEPGQFHPLASSYLEPLIVLAMPGMILWMLLGSSLMCFCYRRYYLGRCGEPFPTVKEYTPKQMAANRLLTATTFAALVLLAMMAMLVVNISMDTAFDALLEATSEIEGLIRTSFGVGRELLDTSLEILAELDAFDAFIAQFVNASAMLDTLRCTGPMLDSLPSGSTVLQAPASNPDPCPGPSRKPDPRPSPSRSRDATLPYPTPDGGAGVRRAAGCDRRHAHHEHQRDGGHANPSPNPHPHPNPHPNPHPHPHPHPNPAVAPCVASQRSARGRSDASGRTRSRCTPSSSSPSYHKGKSEVGAISSEPSVSLDMSDAW